MTLFAALCAAMLALVLLALIWPLLYGKRDMGDVRRARYALHQSVLVELEADQRDGRLSVEDYAIAVTEAEARLIEEVGAADAAPVAPQGRNRLLTATLALIFPLAGFGLYLLLGNPLALYPQPAQQAPIGAEQIAGMVANLEAKLAQDPSNEQGWLMLARSYRVLNRYADAQRAYEKVLPLVEKNAGELAGYASVLAGAKGDMAGKPTELINKALKLEPENPNALMLAGVAAVQRGNKVEAKALWTRLLKQLEAGSEDAKYVQSEIDQLAQ